LEITGRLRGRKEKADKVLPKASAALRMARIPTYVEVFTDLAPQQREMDRFHARHGQMRTAR
jgi:hypothetical protein